MSKKVNRRQFLKMTGGVCGLAAAGGCIGSTRSAKKARPNFIVIMTDDAGPELFGCYGGNVKTPNIDRLAAEGVRFETCWATPMCSPTRAMIMTGRYANKTGWYHNQLSVPFDSNGSNEIDFTKHGTRLFSNFLQSCGYKTAITGRWGIQIGFDHERHGFDEYCLHVYGKDGLPPGESFDGLVESEQGYGFGPIYSRYWHPAIVQNGELLKTKPNDFATDFYADFTLDFAKRNRNNPFCVYMPFHLPHQTSVKDGNMIATTPLSGRPGKLSGGTFAECIEYVDVIVGRIVRGLQEEGLLDNTIIMVTSDNGSCGVGKMKATASGARVPMVIYGPKHINVNGVSGELVSHADVTPTLIDYAEGSVPKGYTFDGISLVPYLKGQKNEHRKWLYSYIATARMLRNKRWVLEAVDEIMYDSAGRFYDTNGSSDPDDYVEVTNSQDTEVLAALQCLKNELEKIPHLDLNNRLQREAVEEYKKSPWPHQMK